MTTIKGDIETNRELPAGYLARCYLESATSMLPAGKYDVEVTVTPRRWAPPDYEWHDDALLHKPSGMVFELFGAYGGMPPRLCGASVDGVLRGVPADAFRAFEKAGLL